MIGSSTSAVAGKGTVSQSGALGSTASANHASSGAQGGVLGATASAGKSSGQGGVLGALAAAGSGELPFTGFPLWIAVVIAAALVVFGLALVRRGRATV